MLTLQIKGVDWYNADCSFEIARYAIPGKCIYNLWLYRTRIYVSHSMKLSTWTGGSTYTQKVYYSSQGYQKRSNSLLRFIIMYI